jgi:hypothetical protein
MEFFDQLRERDDLEKQNGARDKRKDLDYYLCYTIKFQGSLA